jgi:Flp pilus assembly protein TadD
VAVALLAAGLMTAPVAGRPDADAASLRQRILHNAMNGDHEAAAVLVDEYLARAPDDGTMLYNAACVHARLDDLDRADALLLRAVKAGFADISWMQRDPDLIPIRERGPFRAIVAARAAADPVLAARRRNAWMQVLDDEAYRADVDEDARLAYIAAMPDADRRRLRAEASRRAAFLVESLFGEPLRHEVLVVIPAGADRERLLVDPRVHGSYRHVHRQLIAGDTGRALRHELVHVLHHNHMDHLGQRHPMWVQEGLACLFESVVLPPGDRPVVEPNERDTIAAALAARDELPPWGDLMRMGRSRFNASPGPHYAQVRSIFAFLADRGKLAAWYAAYTNGHASDEAGIAALETVFGRRLESIEASWRSWLAERSRGDADPVLLAGTAPPAIPVDAAPTEAPVETPAPDVTADLGAARAHAAAGRFAEAARLLETTVTRAPDHADARYALALAYIRAGDLERARVHEAALARLDPSLGSLLTNLTAGGAETGSRGYPRGHDDGS